MVKRILVLMWWKSYTKLIGQHARGTQQKTLTEFLGLQAGEVVEVRLLREIVATLNKDGRNRGPHFSADQRPFAADDIV